MRHFTRLLLSASLLLSCLLTSAQTASHMGGTRVETQAHPTFITGGYHASPNQMLHANSSGLIDGLDAPSINVKLQFGAVGDGVMDDTVPLQNAVRYMAANGGCLFFPIGAYKTTAQLEWVNQYASYRPKVFCSRGVNALQSYIVYKGTSKITAALYIANTYPAQTFPAVDIQDMGFAANANASYAFKGLAIGPPSNLNNVAFRGGSISAFEGDGWNSQSDLRNLIVNDQTFTPSGSTASVNGLSFSASTNPITNTTLVAGQFTLTMPQVVAVSGIGLNLVNVDGITVSGGQISGNCQNLYLGCASCPGENIAGANTFNNVLLEANDSTKVPNQIYSSQNLFTGLLANSFATDIYGYRNEFVTSLGIWNVEPGAVSNHFIDSSIVPGSTDAGGTGTYGEGNFVASGEPAPLPWNGNVTLPQSRYIKSLPSGTDLHTISACGVYFVPSPVNGPAALADVYTRVQALCKDVKTAGEFETLIVQGYFGSSGGDPNITYASTNVNGTWSSWEAIATAGGTGTRFLVSGCGATSTVGGTRVGKFVSGTTGSCTVNVTPAWPAANDWSCYAYDETTPAVSMKVTASSSSTITFSGITVSGDSIHFACEPF